MNSPRQTLNFSVENQSTDSQRKSENIFEYGVKQQSNKYINQWSARIYFVIFTSL